MNLRKSEDCKNKPASAKDEFLFIPLTSKPQERQYLLLKERASFLWKIRRAIGLKE